MLILRFVEYLISYRYKVKTIETTDGMFFNTTDMKKKKITTIKTLTKTWTKTV